MPSKNEQSIESLFGSEPYFADVLIESVAQEDGKSLFPASKSWCQEGSVNIQRIGGTSHPDYSGMSWRDLIKKGKRMAHNLKLFNENPRYYTDLHSRRQPTMDFIFFDGKGFVASDGYHRSCIARFFLYSHPSPFIHGVNVTEYQTDMRMFKAWKRLTGLLPGYCVANPVSREIRRDDGDGWYTSIFDNRICIENRKRGREPLEFTVDEIEEKILPYLSKTGIGIFPRVSSRFGSIAKLFA